MSDELILYGVDNGVATLTMNNPKRLNGWTMAMRKALGEGLDRAAHDDAVGAAVLTGTGKYYSAGADLSGSFRIHHPRKLRTLIRDGNYQLFDRFIQFPKPILAAVNGIALGAPVTTAVLCDAILASDRAAFTTPFARLGVPAEGCSSVLFPRLFGEETARRILGPEGWRPNAEEAKDIGLVEDVVPHDQLLTAAQQIGENWVAQSRPRTYRGGATKEELERVNAQESEEVADAFLSAPFLMNQYRFLLKKKKHGPALTFLALRALRPAWSLMLR